MRILKVISILPALIFLLAGCGKDEPTTPNLRTFPSELVGTWDFQSVTVNGQQAILSMILDWQEETVRATLTISADGDYVIDQYSADDSLVYFADGTFAANNDHFTLTTYNNSYGIVSPPVIQDGTWQVSGNQLTLYLNINEIIAAIITSRES